MLLHQIQLKNLLSFGPDSKPLELKPLNVLIGPNGSGKSNLIEAIRVLQATPLDVAKPFQEGGGTKEWIWKKTPGLTAKISVLVWRDGFTYSPHMLQHELEVAVRDDRFCLKSERVRSEPEDSQSEPFGIRFECHDGCPELLLRDGDEQSGGNGYRADSSVLSQWRDPLRYPQFMELLVAYSSMRIYRDWAFGEDAPLRQLQHSDVSDTWLKQDCSNLAATLQRLLRLEPSVKANLIGKLRHFSDAFVDIEVRPIADFLQVLVHEDAFATPAIRLSDGTLRYLCLLAILCDPKPPPLICIEEPELGLHPDLIPTIAELLKHASERTQLIVTTHSSMLVDCFNAMPEVIVVCEKVDGQTQMNRLDPEELAAWLEKYRLADLWSRGLIGGNRW